MILVRPRRGLIARQTCGAHQDYGRGIVATRQHEAGFMVLAKIIDQDQAFPRQIGAMGEAGPEGLIPNGTEPELWSLPWLFHQDSRPVLVAFIRSS